MARKIVYSEQVSGAVFEGTRILVANIQKEIARGVSAHELLRSYPALAVEDLDAARKFDPQVSLNGPTLLEFVKAGYDPKHYPPHGYAVKKFTPAEWDQAVAIHEEQERHRAARENLAREELARAGEPPPEHANPPPGFAPCTREWPHEGPCAHPRLLADPTADTSPGVVPEEVSEHHDDEDEEDDGEGEEHEDDDDEPGGDPEKPSDPAEPAEPSTKPRKKKKRPK